MKDTFTTFTHLFDIRNINWFFGGCYLTNYAHVSREHNFRLRVDQVGLVFRGRSDIEERRSELRDAISSSAYEIAAAVGVHQHTYPLQDLVHGLFHNRLRMHFCDHVKDDFGLLDLADILERGRIFDVKFLGKSGGDGLASYILVKILFGELWVILQVLFHTILVCHFEVRFSPRPLTDSLLVGCQDEK